MTVVGLFVLLSMSLGAHAQNATHSKDICHQSLAVAIGRADAFTKFTGLYEMAELTALLPTKGWPTGVLPDLLFESVRVLGSALQAQKQVEFHGEEAKTIQEGFLRYALPLMNWVHQNILFGVEQGSISVAEADSVLGKLAAIFTEKPVLYSTNGPKGPRESLAVFDDSVNKRFATRTYAELAELNNR